MKYDALLNEENAKLSPKSQNKSSPGGRKRVRKHIDNIFDLVNESAFKDMENNNNQTVCRNGKISVKNESHKDMSLVRKEHNPKAVGKLDNVFDRLMAPTSNSLLSGEGENGKQNEDLFTSRSDSVPSDCSTDSNTTKTEINLLKNDGDIGTNQGNIKSTLALTKDSSSHKCEHIVKGQENAICLNCKENASLLSVYSGINTNVPQMCTKNSSHISGLGNITNNSISYSEESSNSSSKSEKIQTVKQSGCTAQSLDNSLNLSDNSSVDGFDTSLTSDKMPRLKKETTPKKNPTSVATMKSVKAAVSDNKGQTVTQDGMPILELEPPVIEDIHQLESKAMGSIIKEDVRDVNDGYETTHSIDSEVSFPKLQKLQKSMNKLRSPTSSPSGKHKTKTVGKAPMFCSKKLKDMFSDTYQYNMALRKIMKSSSMSNLNSNKDNSPEKIYSFDETDDGLCQKNHSTESLSVYRKLKTTSYESPSHVSSFHSGVPKYKLQVEGINNLKLRFKRLNPPEEMEDFSEDQSDLKKDNTNNHNRNIKSEYDSSLNYNNVKDSTVSNRKLSNSVSCGDLEMIRSSKSTEIYPQKIPKLKLRLGSLGQKPVVVQD
jgi:hypothetical protein